MEKSIYNVYVILESYEQFKRLKNACDEKGLETSNNYTSENYFHSNAISKKFCDWKIPLTDQSQVTESEFLELLKNTKL